MIEADWKGEEVEKFEYGGPTTFADCETEVEVSQCSSEKARMMLILGRLSNNKILSISASVGSLEVL